MTMASAGAPAPAERFRPPSQDDVQDDYIDLGAYARKLWTNRMVILVTALVSAASVAFVTSMRAPIYLAETSVIVSQSKVGDRPDSTSTSMSTFLPLLESQNVAASVIQELGLNKPPRNVSATTFFNDLVTVEEVRNSPVVALKVALDDPVLAARTANLVAERAVELSRQVSQQEAVRSRDDLKQQRDDAKTRMEQAAENLRKFREGSQIELVRKDVSSRLDERGELLGLLIQIESEKAKLAKAEQELAGRQRINTVKRSIDTDPALMESARRTTDQAGTLLSIETRNESINPVYEKLDDQIATTRTTLAALENKKAQIVDVRKLDASQVAQLTKLYGLEGDLTRLEMERDLATTVYRQVATAYETAKVQVASRSAQLEILDRAVPPDRPEPRHLARDTVLGLLVGFVLACAGVVIVAAVKGIPPSMSSIRRSV
jgi:uncharacterized protein involved in exopolysaccharide biosynthesis